MEPKDFKPYTIRYTMHRSEIDGFLAELRKTQEDMIERAVAIEQAKGFPKVVDLLRNI